MTAPQSTLERRVTTAAEELLRGKKYVAPVAVLVRMGWLTERAVQNWEQGRPEHLEAAVQVSGDKLAAALRHLREWAAGRELLASEVDYVAATRDRRPLRFAPAGERDQAYRTHWVMPGLSEARQRQVAQRQAKVPDLVVVTSDNPWVCAQCGETGPLHFVEDDQPLCLDCADLGHLVFVPSGDTALTRRAKKASVLSAVVVQFERSRKRFRRRGILVEQAALDTAEEQCFADEELRERRKERDRERRAVQDVEFQAAFAARIADLFPGLAADRARAIADHAATRSSGRVGRSAAGRALDERAVTLAVIASIRHEETPYDTMLMAGVPRAEARDRIRDDIDRVLHLWRQP